MDYINHTSAVDKITLLAKLISNAGFRFNEVKNIKIAIDLARAVDELKLNHISYNMISTESACFLPEHLKQRIAFLRIIIEHWDGILPGLSAKDVSILNLQVSSPKECSSIIGIFETQDIFAEIEAISDIVCKNQYRKICIFCHDSILLKLLRIRFMPEFYKDNYTQTVEIIDMETGFYGRDNMTITKQLNIPASDILIMAGMNELFSNYSIQSFYWLNGAVRKQLGMPPLTASEIIFQSLIRSAPEIFITFSTKIDGTNVRKNNLINSIVSKPFVKSFYVPGVRGEKSETIVFNVPQRLSAHAIETLAESKYDFYIKYVLGLKPASYNDKQNKLRRLYEDFISCLRVYNQNLLDDTLKAIKNLNFYRYQHCLNILSWVFERYKNNNCCFNSETRYEYTFETESSQSITVYTDIDAFINGKLCFFRLFKPKITANDIINGSACAPMVTALIVQKKLGCINEIEILDMHGIGQNPVDVLSIEISVKTLEIFEERLRKILSDNIIDTTEKSDRYKHFKRI